MRRVGRAIANTRELLAHVHPTTHPPIHQYPPPLPTITYHHPSTQAEELGRAPSIKVAEDEFDSIDVDLTKPVTAAEVFGVVDENGDGTLTKDEFYDLCESETRPDQPLCW